MPRQRHPIPPGRVLTRAQLTELGITKHRAASGELRRVLPGVYTSAREPAPFAKVVAAALGSAPPGAIVHGTSAAELLGLPLPRGRTWREGEPVHLALPPSIRRRSNRDLRFHTDAFCERCDWRGMPLPRPIDMLQQLACTLALEHLVACVDGLSSRRRRDELWVPVATTRGLARLRKGRGSARLRAAAALARDDVDSPRETAVRLMLMRKGMPEPVCNHRVVDPDTQIPYWLDLAYPQWKIAIEYDGRWHEEHRQRRHDRYKDELLHGLGWLVLRIGAEDIRQPWAFLARLGLAIEGRSADPRDGSAPTRARPGPRTNVRTAGQRTS